MSESCEVSDRPKSYKAIIRSSLFWKPASAVISGGTLGFLYYYFEGCTSGSCGIASDPVMSVLIGGALGFFFVNRPCKSC